MKKLIAGLLAAVLLISILPSTLASGLRPLIVNQDGYTVTVNDYAVIYESVLNQFCSEIGPGIVMTVESTEKPNDFDISLPVISDTKIELHMTETDRGLVDSVSLSMFEADEDDPAIFLTCASAMLYLADNSAASLDDARAVLNKVINTYADTNSFYQKGNMIFPIGVSDGFYYMAADVAADNNSGNESSDSVSDALNSFFSSGAQSSAFEKIGLDQYVVNLSEHLSEELPYETGCVFKETTTLGTVRAVFSGVTFRDMPDKRIRLFTPDGIAVTDYLTVSDQNIIPQFTDVDGYEWRGMHITAEFHDNHCINYNAYVLGVMADYYSGEVYDHNAKEYGDFIYGDFSISSNRNQYNDCRLVSFSTADFSSKGDVFDIYIYYRLPAGYDGATMGFANTYGYRFTLGHEDNQDSLEEQFAAGGVIFRLK